MPIFPIPPVLSEGLRRFSPSSLFGAFLLPCQATQSQIPSSLFFLLLRPTRATLFFFLTYSSELSHSPPFFFFPSLAASIIPYVSGVFFPLLRIEGRFFLHRSRRSSLLPVLFPLFILGHASRTFISPSTHPVEQFLSDKRRHAAFSATAKPLPPHCLEDPNLFFPPFLLQKGISLYSLTILWFKTLHPPPSPSCPQGGRAKRAVFPPRPDTAE